MRVCVWIQGRGSPTTDTNRPWCACVHSACNHDASTDLTHQPTTLLFYRLLPGVAEDQVAPRLRQLVLALVVHELLVLLRRGRRRRRAAAGKSGSEITLPARNGT
jgi:hypothetical protein